MTFIIASLAVYRIAYMLNAENGPSDIFARFRTWAGVKYDEYSNPVATGFLSSGIICFHCLSVWIGIGVTAWLVLWTATGLESIAVYTLFPFAVSGVASFLKRWGG